MTESSKIVGRKAWKKPLSISLIVWALLSLSLSAFLFSLAALPYTFISFVMMFLGLKISEALIALLTGVGKANALGAVVVFSLKLAWWGALFYLTRLVDARFALAVAIGIGAFLLSIVSAAIWLSGLPKFSFVEKSDS